MEITDLPDYIDVTLTDREAISYPSGGELTKTFQLRCYCFSAKLFNATWPLRNLVMKANLDVVSSMKNLVDAPVAEVAQDEDDVQKTILDHNQFRQMMMMSSSFDLVAAMETFKNIIVANKLVELDEGVHLTRERFDLVDGVAKEKLLFAYLAAFIQPCVT